MSTIKKFTAAYCAMTGESIPRLAGNLEQVVATFDAEAARRELVYQIVDGEIVFGVPSEVGDNATGAEGTEVTGTTETAAEDTPKKTKAPAVEKVVVPEIITLFAETNPKREGTSAHTKFALYRTGMTQAEFLKAGGTSADIRWDVKHGFIHIGPEVVPVPVKAVTEVTTEAAPPATQDNPQGQEASLADEQAEQAEQAEQTETVAAE